MSDLSTCLCCGTNLEAGDGPGRPSAYCGPACRRASQSERQRIARQLEAFELEKMGLVHRVERGNQTRIMSCGGLLKPEDRLQDVQKDIATLRARLCEILHD